jgi:nitrate reductase assembly molybdenum cofactor insertion protein NarJ
MKHAAAYDRLAELVAHPAAGFDELVANTCDELRPHYPEAAAALEQFRALVPAGDPVAQAELHTRTFDVQAVTALDIGYVLFGEDYKRGALLANLSAEHKKAGTPCGLELGDHLTNVLRLLPKMGDDALKQEFVDVLFAPALREMLRDFEPARIAKKEELYKKHLKTLIEHAPDERRLAYRHVLEAIYEVLRADFTLKVSLPLDKDSSYERSVGAELRIEGSDSPCASSC